MDKSAVQLIVLFAVLSCLTVPASACTCAIVNCSTCNSDCSNCTACNSSAPYLNLVSTETQGKSCSVTCTSSQGAYVPYSFMCYTNKACPSSAPFAYRQSDGGETEIVCKSTCFKDAGYQDLSKNCYTGMPTCIINRPEVSAESDVSDSSTRRIGDRANLYCKLHY